MFFDDTMFVHFFEKTNFTPPTTGTTIPLHYKKSTDNQLITSFKKNKKK